MTATLIQSPDRVVLRNISWQTYQSLIADFEQEPAVRVTYDEALVRGVEQHRYASLTHPINLAEIRSVGGGLNSRN